MSQTLTVPRALGGTLIIIYTSASSPVPALQVTAVFRDGTQQSTYRDGTQQVAHRDGTITPGGR